MSNFVCSSECEIQKAIAPHIFCAKHNYRKIVIVAVGTPLCTGDAFGPLVGDILEKLRVEQATSKYEVYGTSKNPVHAKSLPSVLKNINETDFVIAIDASVGTSKDVCHKFVVNESGIKPGNGLSKNLPSVGNISITWCVSLKGSNIYDTFYNLMSVERSIVNNLAQKAASALYSAIQFETHVC